MHETIRAQIAQHDFFAGLSEADLDFLAGQTAELSLAANDMLFREGEKADKFYLLLSGRITVEIPGVYGPSMEIQNLDEGDILGWSWFVPPYEWDFQARASVPSQLLQMDGRAVLEHCKADPQFGFELIRRFSCLMSERLSAARQRMMDQFSPPGFA